MLETLPTRSVKFDASAKMLASFPGRRKKKKPTCGEAGSGPLAPVENDNYYLIINFNYGQKTPWEIDVLL